MIVGLLACDNSQAVDCDESQAIDCDESRVIDWLGGLLCWVVLYILKRVHARAHAYERAQFKSRTKQEQKV
jgi:hypothetical protein